MRINKVYIEDFKNLKQFTIDFDESERDTVLLGRNANGKSNFIEALILIFKYLDLSKTPEGKDYFDFKIEYSCREYKNISIELKEKKYEFIVDGENLPKTSFYKNKNYLPKYVFTYYSGLSNRLHKLFWEHQKRFYKNITTDNFNKENIDDLRRLFYVQQIHSFFVLLAFYSFHEEDYIQKFLLETLHIQDIESILFILNKPSWKSKKGDYRFWNAAGLVPIFLDSLWEYALAPIYNNERISVDFRREETQERLYLFIPDKEKWKLVTERYFKNFETESNNTNLFKALESTYISELLESVKIKVKKEFDGEITFSELSEGEQQLLTVLGLLKFTKDEESLILLDEPDTHLNPAWKWEYLEFLNKIVRGKSDSEDDSTQIIINTHDPLVIGSLKNNQVRIFEKDNETGKITASEPDISPRGLGVAGILTSELFGLKTTLDSETQKLLDRRNELLYKEIAEEIKLSEKENQELKEIFKTLQNEGFTQIFKDPYYTDYLIALEKYKKNNDLYFIDKEAKENIINKILERLKKV